jgi:hypothetical protein
LGLGPRLSTHFNFSSPSPTNVGSTLLSDQTSWLNSNRRRVCETDRNLTAYGLPDRHVLESKEALIVIRVSDTERTMESRPVSS